MYPIPPVPATRHPRHGNPEAGPYIDAHAAAAARRLGLPDDPQELLTEVARGGGEEKLSWLVGALALVDARDEYDLIRSDASV